MQQACYTPNTQYQHMGTGIIKAQQNPRVLVVSPSGDKQSSDVHETKWPDGLSGHYHNPFNTMLLWPVPRSSCPQDDEVQIPVLATLFICSDLREKLSEDRLSDPHTSHTVGPRMAKLEDGDLSIDGLLFTVGEELTWISGGG